MLVTHQRQYLPACDRLLVLRHGRVAAAGTFAELAGLGLSELHNPAGEQVLYICVPVKLLCCNKCVLLCSTSDALQRSFHISINAAKRPQCTHLLAMGRAEAELDDEAYDANMQRGVSLEDCLPEQEAAPAAEDGNAGGPAAAAEAAPITGDGTSATQLNSMSATHATADGVAPDASR